MIDIQIEINKLISYGIKNNLITKDDQFYVANKLLGLFKLDEFVVSDIEYNEEYPTSILKKMLDYAFLNDLIEDNMVSYRDIFDNQIMDCLVPRPSEVINKFNSLYSENKNKATNYFYTLSKKSNYIRTDRISKNIIWSSQTDSGELFITINLSKPEKDPKMIEALKNMKSTSYPKCVLCRENEGYNSRINHPARNTLRLIPIKLNNENWFMQYSPYVYFNEHSIILKDKHEPMIIDENTFKTILEFTDFLPHYFIGSNADLPIVGGSILSHDHFQAGNFDFPMAKAKVLDTVTYDKYNNVSISIVDWPMSVIRLNSDNLKDIVSLSSYILDKWINYSDELVNLRSHTNGVRHNTITPIARKRNGKYELDLVLRNNRTNDEHPGGIFHPHTDIHHIKKENIGLIEVMGLAVLPARLKKELDLLKLCLLNKEKICNFKELEKHKSWFYKLKEKEFDTNTIDKLLENEVALKFERCLIDAGVFKQSNDGFKAFKKFINTL